MKPDWKDAPEWANWLAMDSDGSWWWHECEPNIKDDGGWVPCGKFAEPSFDVNVWGETKEKRP